ncbi:PREDICTED: voltage-dependent calcium channel gamma-like subunit [Aptenodytes forsteri]|uniref:voltage-dependent calcium channel gamma-like subunit n=1 Tax=Aptenodytes forsteri TaxID=9233 RepID=UPI0004F47FCB|nr:PREDICTED: voltage-dependent calcium channel gamma-like subunit [Aptenodytes forsteri]
MSSSPGLSRTSSSEWESLGLRGHVAAPGWDEAVRLAAVTCSDGRKIVSESLCDKGLVRAVLALAQRLLAHRRPQKSFFETLIRSLIILCVAIAVVLSSISVCDGRWLFARGQLFGLWHFCTVSNGSVLKCVTDLSLAKVEGLSVGVIPIRSMVSFAVVVAIFGLELLMVSQVCEDANARRKWSMGSVLILGSFLLSATGVLSFSILVKDHLTFTGFTLTYWCEFIAAFLFFLNGISGLHINSLTHPRNRVGKI